MYESDGDFSDEEIENNNHVSDSEQECSSSEEELLTSDQNCFRGKDNVSKWSKTTLSKRSKIKSKNIVRIKPGPKNIPNNTD